MPYREINIMLYTVVFTYLIFKADLVYAELPQHSFTNVIHNVVSYLFGNNNRKMSNQRRRYNLLLIKEDVINDLKYFPKSLENFSRLFLEYQKVYYSYIRTKIDDERLLNDIKEFLIDTYVQERQNLMTSTVSYSDDEKDKIMLVQNTINELRETVNNRTKERQLTICKKKINNNKLYVMLHYDDEDFKKCQVLVASYD